MTFLQFLLVGLGAFAAGAVNALAGGGTLITFPLLTALGIPAVTANVTNTVALCPGYFGATFAQRKDLLEQKKQLWLLPAGMLGGLCGALLLLHTGEKLFKDLVPWLILLASLLLAVGEPLKKWLRSKGKESIEVQKRNRLGAVLPIGLAAVYGGYFGAGLSVILLASLGLFYNESLTRLNALKQALAFATNIAAAVVFIFSGRVMWSVAAVMAVCALAGGTFGGKIAGSINPAVLRWMVVGIGLVVSIIYFIK